MKKKWKNTRVRIIFLCFVIGVLFAVCLNITFIPVRLTGIKREVFVPKFAVRSSLINIISDTISFSKYTKSPTDVTVTSKCTGIGFPTGNKSRDIWSAVDLGKEAYVFSAYLNEQTRDVVVIGARTRYISVDYCQFWYELNSTHVYMEESSATTSMLPEGRGLRYTAALFRCKCPSSKVPTYISLVTRSCETPLNPIKINSIKPATSERTFTACLMPLNFNYSRDFELIEWIELNRILGAEKFVVYNYSSADNVKRVLKYYSERGLAEVVQWQLPMGVDTFPKENKPTEIYYFAQVAALQDCFYRNQFKSEFIVNIDVDEFIIPHSKNIYNWSDMIQSLSNDSGAYLFRNAFFRKEWNTTKVVIPNRYIAETFKLVTLQKVEHEKKVWLPKQRSKYIARTSDVSSLMIHDVPGIQNGKKLETVPLEIGLLHHYRNWNSYNDPPDVRVVDTTVPDKFSDVLINRVTKVWSELRKI